MPDGRPAASVFVARRLAAGSTPTLDAYENLYLDSCCDQSGGHLFRLRRPAGSARPEAEGRLDRLFLATTAATSLTGFGFPFERLLPSHVVGIISLVALAPAIYGRYARRLAGAWRPAYVIGAILGLYLNVFVAIVQSFLKVPALKSLAPTQSEPPFKITQLVVLALFLAAGAVAVIRFRPPPKTA